MESLLLKKRSTSSIQRSIDGHKKRIIALYKNGEVYKEFDSVAEAAKELHGSRTAIVNVLKGRSKSSVGFLWVYASEYNKNTFYSYNPSSRRIPIYRFDLSGYLIKSYKSYRDFEAIENISNDNSVRSAIKNKTIYLNSYWSLSQSINIDDYEYYYKFKVTFNNKSLLFPTQRSIAKKYNLLESKVSQAINYNNGIIEQYKIEKL